MNLRLGKMTSQEIADWFGLKNAKSLSNKTKNYNHKYEELSEYCEYKKIHGGYEIINIFNQDILKYEKQRPEAYQYVKDNYKQEQRSLDTITRVAAALYTKKPSSLHISYSTIKKYTGELKNKEYGSREHGIGTKGTSETIWSKIIGEIGKNISLDLMAQREYVELTEEELELIHTRFGEWYTDTNQAILDIKEQITKQELTKEEAWKKFENKIGLSDASYADFIASVSDEIKCNWLTKASKLNEGIQLFEDFEF